MTAPVVVVIVRSLSSAEGAKSLRRAGETGWGYPPTAWSGYYESDAS